jgi:YegS C-terminal NAD kinase beta sandwich-like domain
MIKPGEPWGRPTSAAADLEVSGGDADLAAAVSARPRVLVRFRPEPSSDLALAIGLGGDQSVARGIEVPLDVLRVEDGPLAVNMILVGTPPDGLGRFARRFGANVRVDTRSVFHGPCTTVVIATGQFRRGLDLVPRGHPGDGRAEVQIYAVPGRDRRRLRERLAAGTHVPHPKITQRSGTSIRISVDRRVPIEIDGRSVAGADLVEITVVPSAYRLLL